MSGSSARPAKTMSSRLLTMKFMQRAAASAADEPETPSPKRQRLSSSSRAESTPNSDLEAVNAALAAEEQKRAEAVARQAAEAGETNWVLDFSANPAAAAPSSQPMIVAADSLDAENQAMAYGGRTSYGNFQRKNRQPSVHVNDDETSVDADQQPLEAMTEKQRRKAKRNKEEPRLDKLTSLSGGRSSSMDVRGHGHGKKHGKPGKKRSK
ncbi:hypothetical protein UA08_00481 [Talaromyces atroroseus]|uniref:Uncharacterized protein n=1 Tax=Talaromyces atroroseus TaxID=1441469 RepID=A0A225AUD2_TALAT|nr:hypothetical protein UA08_00481 [Talaromyces atroroseus]OKL64540.1 hypothetical protein UA08_00481 [Talaromyces atroroseus]